jgi:uncharacterized protein (TIGR03435 family)
MIPALINHLWQSTVFTAVAALLTLPLTRNRARTRYWLWLAASWKFLVPFSLLINVGSYLPWKTAAATPPAQISGAFEIARPVIMPVISANVTANRPDLGAFFLGIWACGSLATLLYWLVRWRRIRTIVRTSSPLVLDLPVPVRLSPSLLEPGIVGIFRPMLLLPKGITERLAPGQLRAIFAHELCHVRRRDNLTSAIHMLVEAMFWFHPLVWWIGARLVEERERACDEEVCTLGCEPRVYAEAILDVCKMYVESPLVCAAGVTGSDLKKRIQAILTNRVLPNLDLRRKLLLAAAGLAAIVIPVLTGMIGAGRVAAQPQPPSKSLAFEVASVKSNKSDSRPSVQALPGGGISLTNVPLYAIIVTAYNLPFQSPRLSGGPEWIRNERFDIEAKAEPGAIPAGLPDNERDERLRSMLQTLLADRFNLSVRRENKEIPVYALTLAKNGPKMQKAKGDCGSGQDQTPCGRFLGGQGRGVHGKSVDISGLAGFLENWADRPVIDRTNLHDRYDIDTDGWVPMRPRPARPPGTEPTAEDLAFADPTHPTLFSVMESLGLKLEPSKATVETFVIDSVQRPSDN